jgi:hypothetical protein
MDIMLQSLMAELTGATTKNDGEAAVDLIPGKRTLVLFEDTLGALRSWQNDLLKIDGDTLRSLDICVACIPSDSQQPLLNGRPADLPVAQLRSKLKADKDGRFEVILVDFDGTVILRSDGPLTIGKIASALETIGR